MEPYIAGVWTQAADDLVGPLCGVDAGETVGACPHVGDLCRGHLSPTCPDIREGSYMFVSQGLAEVQALREPAATSVIGVGRRVITPSPP